VVLFDCIISNPKYTRSILFLLNTEMASYYFCTILYIVLLHDNFEGEFLHNSDDISDTIQVLFVEVLQN
jgi:hypothetical protein